MAGKIVILAVALSIYKVHSQSIGCCSPSSNINGLKASPQLQYAPGQSCNLQGIPLSLSQLFPQQEPLLKPQPVNVPKQNIQVRVSTVPQFSSSCAPNVQCAQPCPQVIPPVSSPTGCTTFIDYTLANALANALQLLIANDFINSASSKIVNQDCPSIPCTDNPVPAFDLNSFIRNLNGNQLSGTVPICEPVINDSYDWEKLLCYLNGDKKKAEPEPENKYEAFFKYLKEKAQTADQIARLQEPSFTPCFENQDDYEILQAIASYFDTDSCPIYGSPGEVVFPDEIPAQLICNYGYVPTKVPVVNFSVQPVDPNCNFITCPGGQIY